MFFENNDRHGTIIESFHINCVSGRRAIGGGPDIKRISQAGGLQGGGFFFLRIFFLNGGLAGTAGLPALHPESSSADKRKTAEAEPMYFIESSHRFDNNLYYITEKNNFFILTANLAFLYG